MPVLPRRRARTSATTPTFTGYQRDGGYAEYAIARADFVLPIPEDYPDLQAAPLLCAGLIGYRALRLAEVEGLGRPGRLGLYGFGASAHIVIQVARVRVDLVPEVPRDLDHDVGGGTEAVEPEPRPARPVRSTLASLSAR